MAAPPDAAPARRVRSVSISPFGRSTPGVTAPNDGADHGPDDPGTTTHGVQEFLNDHVGANVPGVWWPGIFVVPHPVVVPYRPTGFQWTGPGRDAIRIVPGPGCQGKDMISIGGPGVMNGVRVEGLTFGTRGLAIRHLVNFTNPSGPDAETSTRWVLRDCRFQGNGHTGFTLVMDYNEDSALDDSYFVDGPSPQPGPTTGDLSWRVPNGAGVVRNCVFGHGVNPTYALVQARSFAFRDTVLPMHTDVLTGPGAPRLLDLDHCWQERAIPGGPNFLTDAGAPVQASVRTCSIRGAPGRPVFGGASAWNLLVDQSHFFGDGTPTPFVEEHRGSTVRARNAVFAGGIAAPPPGGP